MAARKPVVLVLNVLLLMAGCKGARQIRDPEYAQVTRHVQQAYYAADPIPPAVDPVIAQLEGPQSVETYIQFAIQQNPDIQAARKRMESLAYQVPVAASLPDPMLNVTAQPLPVQTAAGEQELILAANQKVPWFGKLATRARMAEADTNVARAQLAAAELTTIANVKSAYYELYFIQQAILVTEAEQRLLGEIRDVANTRYKSGQTSQQDVLNAQLEISNIENELIQLRQRFTSGQARLARILHVAPQTQVMALQALPAEDVPQSLDLLQRQAVAARPELHAALATIRRDQRSADLARLDYKPDVTLGVSWIDVSQSGISRVADGQDALMLSAGVNLPVYHKRLDASVRSAEAQAVSSARQYDSLRDGTLEEVADLFARARSQQDMLVLFREDILPKARQTLEVSAQAYNVGEVDFLQLLDNWRQLLRYEVTYRRLEATLRQTLAELERVVGGYVAPPAELVPVPDQDPQAALTLK